MACVTDACGIRLISVIKFCISVVILSITLSFRQPGHVRIVTSVVFVLIILGVINSFIVAGRGDAGKLYCHIRLLNLSILAVLIPMILFWIALPTAGAEASGLTLWAIFMVVFLLWERKLCKNLLASLTARVIQPPPTQIIQSPPQQPMNVVTVNVTNPIPQATQQPHFYPQPYPHPYPPTMPNSHPYPAGPVPNYGQEPPPPYSPPAYISPPEAGFIGATGVNPVPYAANDNYPTKQGLESEQMQRSAPSAPEL